MALFPSRDLNQQFSTFADLAHGSLRWQTSPRLSRSMDQRIKEISLGPDDVSSPEFWVAYWHLRWQAGSKKDANASPHSDSGRNSKFKELPKAHLYAYLQEPCYWNAQDLSRRFNPVSLDISDCFQTAIGKSEQILHSFDPAQGASLGTYASRAFGNAIRDALERHDSLSVCSDLSLLRRSSKKRVKAALESVGINRSAEASCEAAWQCFQAVYFPPHRTARELEHLTQENWDAIAQEYRRLQRHQPGLPLAGGDDLRNWLQNCVVALRRHKLPMAVSLNNLCPDGEQEFLDQLVDGQQADALTCLAAQEAEQARQQQQQQVTEILSAAVKDLEDFSQNLLQLYYGEQLTQTEIANRLGIDQPKVSRGLGKTRQALLRALVAWSRETSQAELHISQESPVLKTMSLLLQDWLTLQFSGERKEHVAA